MAGSLDDGIPTVTVERPAGTLATGRPTRVAGEARHRQMYIGGQWVDASDGAVLTSENPATEECVGTFLAGTAHGCCARWPQRSDEREPLARLDVRDGGAPISEMRTDVDQAVNEIGYFAGIASQTRGSSAPPTNESLTYTMREPYGVVGRIVPFNHPLKFVAGKCAAPLAAGNAVVLKPGEQTSLSALAGHPACGSPERRHGHG